LQSVSKIIINDKHCFELYGFDILLDDQLKPWLIEINASPSMTPNTPQDYESKLGLLEDTYTCLDLEAIMRGDED
jgi:tubulin polyglutamylase TTLL9